MWEAAVKAAALSPDPFTNVPVWSELAGELFCPLCDYNLRGLNEPRCPECGHRFTWGEILDQRSNHPYLFEHQRKRNVWSFCKTFGRDWRPNTFWLELTPMHPVKIGRLLKYWLLANSVIFLLLSFPLIVDTISTARTNAALRPVMMSMRPPSFIFAAGAGRRVLQSPLTYTPAYVNSTWPVPWTKPFFIQVWKQFHWRVTMAGPIVLILLWPWLTVLALLVFRISMRRARINTRHVVRCAIYCCDFSITVVAALLVLSVFTRADSTASVALAIILCPAISLYRLTVAYKRYMRLDHPFFTALASQVIVTLAVIDFALNS